MIMTMTFNHKTFGFVQVQRFDGGQVRENSGVAASQS